MEIVRQKNVATYIYVPLVDADGDPVTSAGALDSKIDAWADGTAPNGFIVCTNEATEVGSSGCYYLSLTQSEMNNDYIMISIASTSAKTQWILIRTIVGDPLLLATTAATDAIKTDTAAILIDTDTMEADLKTYLDAIETNLEGDIEANDTLIDTAITDIGNLNDLASSDVQTVLETNDLDHLLKIAHPSGDPVVNTILDLIMNKDGTQTFARADDSLQGISEGAAGGGASAQEVWEYASPRTLTTPADYKATGFSVPNEYDTVIASLQTDLDNPAQYKATGFATAGEYDVVIAALQTDLDNPNQYKANVGSLALEASVQAIKTLTDNLPTDTEAVLNRLKALHGEWMRAEQTFDGDDNIKIGMWFYNNQSNWNTHNKSTGIVAELELVSTFTDGKPTTTKVEVKA